MLFTLSVVLFQKATSSPVKSSITFCTDTKNCEIQTPEQLKKTLISPLKTEASKLVGKSSVSQTVQRKEESNRETGVQSQTNTNSTQGYVFLKISKITAFFVWLAVSFRLSVLSL